MVDDKPVDRINANLTAGVDVTIAKRLPENAGIAFRGPGTALLIFPAIWRRLCWQTLAIRISVPTPM